MIHGVANHVHHGIHERLGHPLVHARLAAGGFKGDIFPKLLRKAPHQAREAREHRLDRHDAKLQGLVAQAQNRAVQLLIDVTHPIEHRFDARGQCARINVSAVHARLEAAQDPYGTSARHGLLQRVAQREGFPHLRHQRIDHLATHPQHRGRGFPLPVFFRRVLALLALRGFMGVVCHRRRDRCGCCFRFGNRTACMHVDAGNDSRETRERSA